jgi:hypothetical protein
LDGATKSGNSVKQGWSGRKHILVAIALAVPLAAAILGAVGWAKYKYLRAHADTVLRERMISSLSARFHSPVELDSLHLDASDGVKVTGSGLRILYLAGPTVPDARPVSARPMLSIDSFEFNTDFKELFKPTTRILTVYVRGMQLDIPPKRHLNAGQHDDPKKAKQSRVTLTVDKIVCTDSKIVIETSKPGKLPLVFNIANVTLTDVGTRKPLLYDATLTNPKPIGQVRATGHFGPWQADDPRGTAIDGTYWFTHADLGPFKGIAGILSSTGNFKGSLGEIAVEGETDVPDFRLDVTDRPVPLHTEFKAVVDGLSGDTFLHQVDVRLLNSTLHASGSIVRLGIPATGVTGHDTELDVTIGPNDHARIEDLLTLAMKTSPPIMRGSIAMQAHLSVPPGKVSVSKKMGLKGSFTVRNATFSNPKFQNAVDMLSMRAQGKPKEANAASASKVDSTLSGDFNQANALMELPRLVYAIPGAQVNLVGQYSLDGQRFEFKGDVRTDATMSQMTTGWKSMLLKPFDPLMKRDGAGLELPVTISGTKSAPKFGIDTKRLFQ